MQYEKSVISIHISKIKLLLKLQSYNFKYYIFPIIFICYFNIIYFINNYIISKYEEEYLSKYIKLIRILSLSVNSY